MSVTIEDVARRLSLSVSTVSKALNDYPDISAETKKRVIEVAAQLGYHPSSAARSLRKHCTERIGVVNATMSYNYDYFMELLRGVTVAAELADYNLVLYTNIHNQPQRLQRICRAHEVDGVILMGADDMSGAVEAFMAEDLPLVVLGRCEERPDVAFIAPDAVAGGALATRHLIELGHRRIGFITSSLDVRTCNDRMAGYRQALAEVGIAFDPALIAEAPFRPGGGGQAMEALLRLASRPTAVVAISNTVAQEAMRVLADHGLRVPQDVAIVGFDDTWLSLISTPPLTSVRQPLFEMGRQSVEMLLARIAQRDQPPCRVVCPVTLVVRESTLGFTAKGMRFAQGI
ncbi:MAG: LacI family DNA-binding transcriptional regulator [Anaerolineae bacterium]